MDTALEKLLRAPGPDPGDYRPVLFNLPADEAALRTLLEKKPGLRITDRIEAQARELVKSLHPHIRFTAESLQEKTNEYLSDKDLTTFGPWVFYPWADRLVHLLPEAEFTIVRTDRNRNKITREEQAVLATRKIGVIGLSVGQSVSLTMALERCFGEIRLADFDTLDLSNLNRIRTGTHHLGMNKAVITAREIAELDPYLKVTCFTDGLTKENMDAFFTEGGPLDILVEECDSVDIKILARQKAKTLGIPVVMDMSDRGCLDVERFDLEPERPLMHGWIDHLDLDAASRPMSAEEKVPYMLPITGVETLSPRMKASVIELGQTISTWPQLATSVVLGGALAGDAVRRIALGQFHKSGRWFVDLEELVADDPAPAPPSPVATPPFALTADELAAIDQDLGAAPAEAVAPGADILEQLVKAGGLAPSAGNMQPWKFLWHQKRLLLFHDKARSASFWDPDHLIAHIALGACIENIVLKAHALGLEAKVDTAPGMSSNLIARFTFSSMPGKNGEPHSMDRLAATIETRRTDRSIGAPRAVPDEVIDRITNVAGPENATIHWVRDTAQLQELAGLHGRAERIRLMHPEGHREYFREWMRWTAEDAAERRDGLDLETFALPPMAEAAMRVMADPKAMGLLRTWGGGRNLAALPAWSISSASAVALITIPSGDIRSQLRASRSIQRLWLAANAENWAIQPVPSILSLASVMLHAPEKFTSGERAEIDAINKDFRHLFQLTDRIPIFLLRLFANGATTKRAARRKVHELLPTPATIIQ